MPFQIVCNDITQMTVDAVVNAANEGLQMGGGVCGAIFQAAGPWELQRECDAIGHCPTGQAVITGGYGLSAKHVIHTVGPVWQGGTQNEAALLESCYLRSLALAEESGCSSVAFPLISSGIFGYPREEALRIAADAITGFLTDHDLLVYLVLFDRRSFSIGEERLRSIQRYIDAPLPGGLGPPSSQGERFSRMLLRLVDGSGRSDMELCRRANVDRKLLTELRDNPSFHLSKATATAFAVALELDLNGTRDLLSRAGYPLSPGDAFDGIVAYFIEHGMYNIHEINEALFAFDQVLLGD